MVKDSNIMLGIANVHPPTRRIWWRMSSWLPLYRPALFA